MTPAAARAPRREKRSASAPVGTSAAIDASDQTVKSAEIVAVLSPLLANRRAYSE
jgi:hypothetical protein